MPKLVFLHGLMGSGANWRKITSQLQDQYQILIYDQRGHGRSFHGDSYEPEDYSSDLALILDELGWDEISLVGHSMGGRNAMNFAYRFPQRVRCLVVEDIGPEASKEAVSKIERLLNLVPVPFEDKMAAKHFFENEFPRRLLGNPQAQTLANYFYTNISEQGDGTANWRFSLDGILQSMNMGRKKDRWNEVAALSMPTLWIRGGNSDELSQDVFQRVLKTNPLIEGVEVSEAGHWVHFDKVEEFTRLIRDFLLNHR